MTDLSEQLQAQINHALAEHLPLNIQGSGSKAFYGRVPSGHPLTVAEHSGIVHYEPTELVITARAGTPLREIEAALAAHNQCLPFEPPYFGANATLGGTLACNLSGPRRAYTGAARDFVLGTKIINGKGDVLKFGGEVMKNVAGYDVSRLMCGAMGTLGVLLEASLKVLPRPEAELTLCFELALDDALQQLHRWNSSPLPLSASCYVDEYLSIRLAGAENALTEAREQIGGDALDNADAFWEQIKEQQHHFFTGHDNLWRVSLASDTPPLPGEWLYEWGGALRWFKTKAPAADIRELAQKGNGHATLFRGHPRDEAFQALAPGLMALHQRLKQAFDPQGILNPGRMYEGL
jgi:glycolate oxidase FAD binding subunit